MIDRRALLPLVLLLLAAPVRADEIPVPVKAGRTVVANGPVLVTFDVPELAKAPAIAEAPDAARWAALFCVDGVARDDAVELVVTLSATASRRAYETRLAVVPAGGAHRAVLTVPAADLTPGTWKLALAVTGSGTFRVDAVRAWRVPVHEGEMRFAKSNGRNGPDRLESGALGFVGHTADGHAPLPVVRVRPGSPADLAGLEKGDVIVAVAGRPLPASSCRPGHEWFRDGHEAVLGRAVEAALHHARPRVTLSVIRGRNRKELTAYVAPRPPLPDDFPFDRTITPRLYDDLMGFIRRTRQESGRWSNGGIDWIQTSFAGLALLGRRDPQDARAVRETAAWFMKRFPEPKTFGNLGFWSASYAGIFMCEYLLATGDAAVRPWIEAALRWIEGGFHESKWGTKALGHGPSGLPYDDKALMAPAAHVIVFEALARKAGIESRIWETLLPYMIHSWSDPKKKGHGAMGYNGSYRDEDEFWSRTGLFALAARLRGERAVMRRAMVKIMGERHAWMRNSHAYGQPGDTWGLIGLAHCERKTYSAVMKEWRWAYGGAWQPKYGLRHTTAHMGSPYMGGEGLINPATAVLLSARHRGLVITGAEDRGWLEVPSLAQRAEER